MTGFRTIAEGLIEAEGGYRFDIPDNWRQGRTAYGGLTAGLSLAAVQREFTDLPPLRSLMINFIGPITDNPVFRPLSARMLLRRPPLYLARRGSRI